MRLGRLRHRVGCANPQGDPAIFNEGAQPVQSVEVLRVGSDGDRRYADVSFANALIAAQRHDGAAVLDGRQRKCIEQGTVGQAIDAIGKECSYPERNIRPTAHDNIGSEVPDEYLVGDRGIRDHGEPFQLGQLDEGIRRTHQPLR